MPPPSEQSLKLKLFFSSQETFKIEFESSADAKKFQTKQKRSRIRAGIELYLVRLQELTARNVPESLRNSLPQHFHSPARVLVGITVNGIAIRYEPASTTEVVVLSLQQSLQQFVPTLSLGLIQVVADGTGVQPLPEGLQPPTFNIMVSNANGDHVKALGTPTPIQWRCHIPSEGTSFTTGMNSPKASFFRNQMEMGVEGIEQHDQSNSEVGGRSFVTRGKFAFPLFWDFIAIYPWADYRVWRKADFESWAERHFFEQAFRIASSEYSWLATASQTHLREHYQNVLSKLDALLAKHGVQEEDLQQFLTSHPEVLTPGYKRVLPKLALGAHVTDFVIEDATGHYLLIELENPSQPLFVKSGHASAKLTHAEGQVKDWIRYIQDNKATVEKEQGLLGISAQPSALVVIGRSNSLSVANRRKMQVDQGRTEVITYDDLRARFVKTIENLLGMLAHVGQNYDVAYLPTEAASAYGPQ